MSVNLTKGGNVSLTKTSPTTTKYRVGLGWDANETSSGKPFDLDVSAFVLGADDKVLEETGFVFYRNLNYKDFVVHSGDNTDGKAAGDDETLIVDSTKAVTGWSKIKFVVTIHDAVANNQNFGQIRNSYIRIVDEATNEEIVKYDLNEDYSVETALEFGEIYLNGTDVKFRAVGTGQKVGLASYCTQYGINVG